MQVMKRKGWNKMGSAIRRMIKVDCCICNSKIRTTNERAQATVIMCVYNAEMKADYKPEARDSVGAANATSKNNVTSALCFEIRHNGQCFRRIVVIITVYVDNRSCSILCRIFCPPYIELIRSASTDSLFPVHWGKDTLIFYP